MRPPLNAGENHANICSEAAGLRHASMRPPLNAGENLERRAARRWLGSSFNEAPAERGGKRLRRPVGLAREHRTPSFNEAPAERGGKRGRDGSHLCRVHAMALQ